LASERRPNQVIGQSLAERRFGPYEAALLLQLAGDNPRELKQAVETIVGAVAAGQRPEETWTS
jgi:hypothetical protein